MICSECDQPAIERIGCRIYVNDDWTETRYDFSEGRPVCAKHSVEALDYYRRTFFGENASISGVH